MDLYNFLTENQIEILRSIGIIIEKSEYNSEEIYETEQIILEYINNHCADEEFYNIEQDLDDILDILMDLENEENQENPFEAEIFENDHVKLTNGKSGTVIDITNGAYTIEIDEEYKTGSLDEDIAIVAQSNIVGRA